MNRKNMMRFTGVGCLVWACGIVCLWRPVYASYMAPGDPPPTGLFVMDTGVTSKALNMSGSSTLIANGVFVNSSDAKAVVTSGSAAITARDIMVVGSTNFGSSPGYTGTLTCSCAAQPDPCSGLTIPTSSGMTDKGSFSTSTNATIQPGYYSGQVKVSGGTLTFAPGVYVLGNGLDVSSASIAGEGVTLVIAGGKLNFSGSSSAQMNTTTTAPVAGATVIQPSSNTNKITLSGGSSFVLGGIIYAPSAPADLSGSSSTTGGGPTFGESFICKTANLSGSASIKIGRTYGVLPTPSAAATMD